MVVFICAGCGDSVKKASVDKHWVTQCRRRPTLSCIDCGKDFPGDTFRNHNSCMTEQEKWHGKDFQPKESASSGKQKQDAWTDSIQRAAFEAKALNPHLSSLLQRLIEYDNVPRKEAKFKNFLRNCMRVTNPHLVAEMWKVVEKPREPEQPQLSAVTPEESHNPVSPEEGSISRADKSEENGCARPSAGLVEVPVEPLSESVNQGETGDSALVDDTAEIMRKKFKWKRTIASVLSSAESTTLSRKKLKRKVLEEYGSYKTDEPLSEEVLTEKFEKYLNKYPDLFLVDQKTVKLATSE